MVESKDWNVFYSGDTKPNLNHIKYGNGTTLLIHEATFEDALKDEAEKKLHSTVGQAIHSSIKMSAWRTCLTHYSPRYSKLPPITDAHFSNKVM